MAQERDNEQVKTPAPGGNVPDEQSPEEGPAPSQEDDAREGNEAPTEDNA